MKYNESKISQCISQYMQGSTCSSRCRHSFTEHLRWLLLDICGSKHFFESCVYWWQSPCSLLRTPLKTRVKPQRQPLELFCKKSVLINLATITGKHRRWSLFLTDSLFLSGLPLLITYILAQINAYALVFVS